MKIDELIRALQVIRERYGNIDVRTNTDIEVFVRPKTGYPPLVGETYPSFMMIDPENQEEKP